jgi:hypothetical protein
MTQRNLKFRSALTAIAAVIALSATSALAQQTSVPDPVIDSTPVTATPDPLAPEPVSTTAEPSSEPAASTPVKKTVTKAAPSTRRSAAAARSTAPRPREAVQAALAASSTPAEQASTEATPPALAEIPAAAAAPAVQAPAEQPAPIEQAIDMDEALPIVGAAGLGLFALAGAGIAMRRRKRRREEDEFEERQMALTDAEAEPVVRPEPAFVRPATPLHDPVPGKTPVTALPAGFDISKFGRHVQAAYRGPTPDNPSLSLKNRLRRASFFDQQERRTATEAKAAPAAAQPPAWMAHKPNDAEFLFRPSIRKTAPKPEFQK